LRENAALAKSDVDSFTLGQLREANEKLVIASLRSQALTEASEHANVLKEQFLAMLAHEMRNPLAPIVNALEVLHRVKTTDPMVPWAHDVIKRQVNQMTRLINDLLDVARINTGKIELQLRSVTVEEIMRMAVETSAVSIRDRKQTLEVYVPPRPLYIHGDHARLVQVFSNLLNNAAKYTQEGGAIKFLAQHLEKQKVAIRVSDNGCGIAADALPDIFKLFTQEDRSLARSGGGLGVGLTVARGIIELHEGSISATSAGPGEGCEFAVTLPLLDEPIPDGSAAVTSSVPPNISYRVAVIEDNIDTATSMKKLLEMMGHKVGIATNGAAGVDLVLAERPHIVLCDIGLPVMDGYAVVAKLKAEMPDSLPLVIAATGYGKPEDGARISAAGFDAHIVKPVRLEDLLREIAAHADRLLPH
jgi:CheY-like chemotaxis protein